MPKLCEPAFGMPADVTFGMGLGNDIGALRALDAEAQMIKFLQARLAAEGTVDGKVLPAQIVDILDRGEQAEVPIQAGLKSGEIRSQRLMIPAVPMDPAAHQGEITKPYGDLASGLGYPGTPTHCDA